ncbi:unnamed protein product [Parnassius mnemosyne]|uniref:PHD-type domain-containing protein n=1 Tax=Parnassius mnemosyne TaxID=213953 RepID=A0AAV1LLU0_9NEOP
MMCAACESNLKPGEEFLQCMNESCGKLYHYLCNNQTLILDERSFWICPECRCTAKRGGNNSEIPVGSPIPVRESNITIRKIPSVSLKVDSVEETCNITSNFKILQQQMSELNTKFIELFHYIHKCHEKIDDSKDMLTTLTDKVTKIENRGTQNQVCTTSHLQSQQPSTGSGSKSKNTSKVQKLKNHKSTQNSTKQNPIEQPTTSYTSAIDTYTDNNIINKSIETHIEPAPTESLISLQSTKSDVTLSTTCNITNIEPCKIVTSKKKIKETPLSDAQAVLVSQP